MQLYTLTSSFLPRDIVSDFVSAIWTERYSAAGDVQIVAPATPDVIDLLSQGTFLGLRGTREIMLLETQSIENGLLTVTGKSLTEFLNARHAQFPEAEEFTLNNLSAGQFIAEVVRKIAINPIYYDEEKDKIVGLELGQISDSGTIKRLSVSPGPLYEAIQKIAQEEEVGFKLYLKSARFSTGYVLRFTTWLGKNRTSEQDVHSMVRLTPQMDSLTDVKELTSIAEYKNVIYVSYEGTTSIHYAEPTLPIPEGFNRRVLQVDAPTIYIAPENRTEFRAQVARNTIAEHVYIKAVDGQVSTEIGYKYGLDYFLGDIIELEGFTGLMSKARVTEYIRSQDQFGDREYPTLSVIDPLFTGYMPDVEPNEDDDDFELDEDPEFDLDFDDDDFDDWDDEDLEDLDANRRKRRRRPKPKPTAPDPDLNPVPDDPNPDPEPDFEDRGGGGVYDDSKVFEWENAGFRYMESPEGFPPGARFEVHFEDPSPEDSWDYNLHISGETRIRVNRPHPSLPDPAAIGGTNPGHFGALTGPLMSFAIYEDIFYAAAMNPLYEIIIPVNDIRAIRSFTGDLGGEIHMDWAIQFKVPGKLVFPPYNVVAHHFWVSGLSDVSHLMPSHAGWIAGPTPLNWETPKIYAVYSWKTHEEPGSV